MLRAEWQGAPLGNASRWLPCFLRQGVIKHMLQEAV